MASAGKGLKGSSKEFLAQVAARAAPLLYTSRNPCEEPLLWRTMWGPFL
jgi:hypothetical protein